jgi:uncharacterized membrane protein
MRGSTASLARYAEGRMNVFGFDFGGFILGTVILSLVVPLVITGVVIGVIVWTIRRTVPTGRDAAIAELRGRLANGEIDPAEFQARVDALNSEN